METEDKAEELADGKQNLRAVPRFEVDADAHLLLVKHGSTLPCRIADLSLTGCRACTEERFPAGTMVRVELSFSVHGLVFRFGGITQWTDGRHQVGIRFVDVPARRKEELIEALSEVEVENTAKAAKRAAEELAAEEQAAALEAADAAAAEQAAATGQEEENIPPPFELRNPVLVFAARPPGSHSKPAWRARRALKPEEVDMTALIHLMNAGSWLQGRILDLSPSGCRIRTGDCFPVAIHTRVETEFRVDGLPFRLDGVIQGIRDGDRRNVNIRFLEMSMRKREQVDRLIEEIEELKGQETRATEPEE